MILEAASVVFGAHIQNHEFSTTIKTRAAAPPGQKRVRLTQ